MKPQDFMDALGGISQERLDALAKWQKSGTPLTGAEPETDNPARTVKPVITQRRNRTMKQKTEKTRARLRAWTAGIAAAVVLCTAVAVPVGREAVRRAQQSNAGYAESEPAEPVTEVSAEKVIVPDGCTFFHWEDESDLAGYYDCLPADTKLYAFLDELGEEQPPLEAGRLKPGNVRQFVYEEDDEVYDIYFIGLPMQEVPDNLEDLALITGTLTQSGKLHLQIGALTDAEQAVRYFETEKRQYAQPNTAFVFAVPEGALPEITEVSTSYDEIPLEPFLTDAPEAESERLEWYVHLVEQNRWLITANGETGIRLIADEPAEEILTVDADPQPDTVQAPQYVQLMQEYYTQKSGIPCDFDFSGMGRDLDEIIENPAARIHIKGMVGCDWTMFVFFDTEPLNLSVEDERYFSESSFMNLSNYMYPALGIEDADGNTDPHFQQICRTMPAQQSLDDGVFHCYCLISSHSDAALTGGTLELGIGKMNDPRDPVQYDLRIPLDCLQTIPLQESELAATVSTFIPDDTHYNYPPNTPMTRSAVTPFGVYCVSNRYETGPNMHGGSCYWLELPVYNLKGTPEISQTDEDGLVIGKIELDGQTSWGAVMKDGTGVSFTDFLFERPFDAAKGTLNVD